MTTYPKKYPMTIWKYEKAIAFTCPGMEINVTPEIEVPIMPKATRNQGEVLLAVKKVWLSFFLDVTLAIMSKRII